MYDRSSSAEYLKENVSPRTQSSSASNSCMVVRGGAIPETIQAFPVMEHDRGLFNGMSQDTTPNGFSQDSNLFDDEREIEAAAAASEAQMNTSFAANKTNASSPVILVPPAVVAPVAPLMPSNQTFSPLSISIGDVPKCTETSSTVSNGSKESDSPNNGFQIQKKPFHPPPLRNIRDQSSNRPSTSAAPPSAPIIMGPPTNSNAPVLLSPAGNLHNGYHRRSSGDSAPSSPSFVARSKGNQFVHPLSVQRSLPPPSRLTNNVITSSGPASNRSSTSTTSPQSGRKEHEMTRRRALVDRIAKSRGPEYVHLLPQMEGLTTTQTSILLRKHRGTLQSNKMPVSMQNLIDCGGEADTSSAEVVKKIRDMNQRRVKHNDFEDLTDLSDLEEDFGCYDSQERKKQKDAPRWAPKRMRYSGMLSRAEVLLAEKNALMGMLKNQKTVMEASCAVRFEKEEAIRRRRQLNGVYYLYSKTPAFVRRTAAEFGCSRFMPVSSWVRRKPLKNVFDNAKEDSRTQTSSNAVLKPSANADEKWVATAQHTVVTYLTEKKETRETCEYDYEEFKIGEGLQQVNELSSFDPVEFITPSDFTPFEERQMAYMYRLATAPSCTIRKKHGRSIYFETDDRKSTSEKGEDSKKKSDKKKERKRVDDASSDDEESWTASKPSKQKRARGRPAAKPGRKKTSRASVSTKPDLLPIYMDYLFDDHMHEEFNPANVPPPPSYANIHIPYWDKVPDDFWQDMEEPASGVQSEDLYISVARGHHRIMHNERMKAKKEAEKRNRNRQAALKSAASTPSQNNTEGNSDDVPFDIHFFDPHYDPSRRRFQSVVAPYVQRDFLSPPLSES